MLEAASSHVFYVSFKSSRTDLHRLEVRDFICFCLSVLLWTRASVFFPASLFSCELREAAASEYHNNFVWLGKND